MNSSASRRALGVWMLVAVIAACSVGLKVVVGAYDLNTLARRRDEPQRATRILGRFLTAHSDTPITSQPQMESPDWKGWRFSQGGCQAIAFPSPRNAELDARARDHAGADDSIAYFYRGRRVAGPPNPLFPPDYLVFRLLQPLNLGDYRANFYVTLIYPSACPGLPGLPWNSL